VIIVAYRIAPFPMTFSDL